MANKYANLVGTNKIKDEYSKINTGFDKVEADINDANIRITAVDNRVDTIITTPIDDEAAAQELVDARAGFSTIGGRMTKIEEDIETHKAENASLAKKGHVQLSSSLTSISESMAATPKAVKDVNDKFGGWIFYGTLSALGITEGTETIESIINAMADKSELRYIKVTTNPANIYPATSGMFIVRKFSLYRVELRFIQGLASGGVREWVAYYDVNITPNFTGWKEVITTRQIIDGAGSPEGVVAAPVGTLYRRADGGASTTLYIKESGTGNTGWKAVQTA